MDRGLLYLLGMVAATVCGSAFVIGGMLGGASGWSAVVLAAVIPLAGLNWVLILSLHDKRSAENSSHISAEYIENL